MKVKKELVEGFSELETIVHDTKEILDGMLEGDTATLGQIQATVESFDDRIAAIEDAITDLQAEYQMMSDVFTE